MRAAIGWLIGALALSLAPPARGQRAPGEHVHDGFYVQLGLGPSLIRDSYDTSGGGILFDDSQGTVSGFGHAQHLAIGGAVAPGLVIAGALLVDIAHTTSADYEGAAIHPKDRYALFAMGPLVDWYFDPEAGLHALVGGGFGVASSVEPEGVDDSSSASGYALFAGLGHEWWIAEQWGMGALLRVTHVRAEESVLTLITDTYEVHHSGVGIALMLSATYN